MAEIAKRHASCAGLVKLEVFENNNHVYSKSPETHRRSN